MLHQQDVVSAPPQSKQQPPVFFVKEYIFAGSLCPQLSFGCSAGTGPGTSRMMSGPCNVLMRNTGLGGDMNTRHTKAGTQQKNELTKTPPNFKLGEHYLGIQRVPTVSPSCTIRVTYCTTRGGGADDSTHLGGTRSLIQHSVHKPPPPVQRPTRDIPPQIEPSPLSQRT